MSAKENVLPSSAKVRSTLLDLEEGEVKVDVGSWAIPMDGKKAKMGFIYEYLTASRVAEVFGKYAPKARHYFEMKIEGDIAVLFIVKSAKKKTKRGWLLRPVLVPLNPKYEVLGQLVLDYVKARKSEFGDHDYPFMLHDNPETSKRYAEAYMKKIFKEYSWSFVDYLRTAYAHPSLGYTIDPQIRKRKQLTEEEFRSHGDKISYDRVPGWVPVSVKVDTRWKSVNTMVLRSIRLRDLDQVYEFDSQELETYAGWKHRIAYASRHYIKMNELELDIDEDQTLPRTLAAMAKPYFSKLTVPIGRLLNPQDTQFDGIEFL
jgi:hypothetical protein